MPFITEELYHALQQREEGESIMHASFNSPQEGEKSLSSEGIREAFENVKQIIAGIRTIRLQKNILQKDMLKLFVKGEYNSNYDEIIKKLCNVEEIFVDAQNPHSAEKSGGVSSFLVGTTEFSIPVEINVEEEIARMENEIVYLEGFLKSVNAKLSNEKFVANAKPEIVENERKKHSDAESKIKALRESIAGLKEMNINNSIN
jgi:valyl-tRNA synthetase